MHSGGCANPCSYQSNSLPIQEGEISIPQVIREGMRIDDMILFTVGLYLLDIFHIAPKSCGD